MSSSQRSRFGGRLAFALSVGVLFVSCCVMAAAGGASPQGRAQEGTSTCPPIPGYSGENSTLFQEICAEPQFQAALQERGVANFTTSELVDRGGTTFYLGISWVDPCGNVSGYSPTNPCAFQEYWEANVTSGTISGPVTTEGPVICSCGEVAAASTRLQPVAILLIGGIVVVAASLLGVMLLRRRAAARRPPGSPNSRGPPST